MVDPAMMQRLIGAVTSIKYTLAELALTANTATPCSASPLDADRGISIQMHPDNPGNVRVGGSTVDATHGHVYGPEAVVWIGTDQVQDVYLYALVAGCKVNILVF